MPQGGTEYPAMGAKFLLAMQKAIGAPTALVFFDIRAAFYSILPEMALGPILRDEAKHAWLAELAFMPEEIQSFEARFTGGASWKVSQGFDPTWAAALADWSSRTWFSDPGDEDARVYHLTGTRPRHPAADLVFNFVFAFVQIKLVKRAARHWLATAGPAEWQLDVLAGRRRSGRAYAVVLHG